MLFFELFSAKSCSWTMMFPWLWRTCVGKRYTCLFQWNTIAWFEDDSIAWQTSNWGIMHYFVWICCYLSITCEEFVRSIWENRSEQLFSGRLILFSMFDEVCTSKKDFLGICLRYRVNNQSFSNDEICLVDH